eukprot:7078295-Pyramimonas_sp.AAC.1
MTSRKDGKREKHGEDGRLRWDDAAVTRAQAVAAASRAAEGGGAGAADGAPQVVTAKKTTASSVRERRSGLAKSGLNERQRS